ncbi:MAG: phosphotransferase [Ilumatobacteraceae bacterium]
MHSEEPLVGGGTHVGQVIRVGDTVRRPRAAGAELVESFLLHLERVGFEPAPRYRGVDELGRQILTYIEGVAVVAPSWLDDDDANRLHLVDVAQMLHMLHAAGEGFAPPRGAAALRSCPAPGTTWLHGDVHYGNLVFRGDEPVALLDWDFVTRGDPLYDVVTLLFSARCPRLDRPDEFEERCVSARRTLAAVLDGYGADCEQRRRAPGVASVMSAGAADYLADLGPVRAGASSVAEFDAEIARRRFLGEWWRDQTVA